MSEEKKKEEVNEEKVDVKKIIKDLSDLDWEKKPGKAAQMLKGLSFAEDPLSDKYMAALSKAATQIAGTVLKENLTYMEKANVLMEDFEPGKGKVTKVDENSTVGKANNLL